MSKDISKLTPMMRQYLEVKERYPDAFLFFRVGDFYELFFEDAIKAASILNIALTSRDKNEKDAVPLCGVPYHAVETYLKKMVTEGYKVVLCDQVEDPKFAKGIVKREVVRVITPGTVTDFNYLDPKDNNYIAAIYREDNRFGVAFADVSCGEVSCFETDNLFKDLFERLNLKEVLVLKSDVTFFKDITTKVNLPFSFVEINNEALPRESLESKATTIITHYLSDIIMLKSLENVTPTHVAISDYLFVDENSKRDLEILEPVIKGSKNSSLFDVMDSTITSMGSRKLKQFLLFPLLDKNKINERYSIVETFVLNSHLLTPIRDILKGFSDLERIIGNLFGNAPSPKHLVSLKDSLKLVGKLRDVILTNLSLPIRLELRVLEDVINAIDVTIVDDPPFSLRDGNFIKKGYSKELDELREIIEGGTEFLFKYQQEERERTGINSLKVGYNKIFGYYIEVTKANLHLIPSNYIRKQTLVNAERFITDELKSYEDKVLSASEKFKELEQQLFKEFINTIRVYSEDIKKVANEIALLDVFTTFAFNAIRFNYTKPEIVDDLCLKIEEGRHPFVERNVKSFVPNDTSLVAPNQKIMLLTGPNMSGKSTYMRQVALIVLMAQTGSFVPAKSMNFSIVDQILTRIGTSDFLASGKSTFMVEMIETARILKESTDRSLVILDEVGRGTSTYDGMSIAWASLSYLADKKKSPFVMFSTHYHEIAELANKKGNIKNYNIAVKEWNKEIIFLHKLKEGIANKSYGIHVAKLAGLPEEVIRIAEEILRSLEDGELFNEKPKIYKSDIQQLTLFGSKEDRILEELKNIQLESLTPLEAFDFLRRLKEMIKQ